MEEEQIMPAQILKAFFAIQPCRISADFQSLRSQRNSLRDQEKSFSLNGWETSSEVVESFHRRLLLAADMSRVSKLPGDLLLFSATLVAHEIAELCCSVSTGRGRLRELASRDESLTESEWLKEGESLSDSLLQGIHDSVFLEVLTRYGMARYAEIFEGNRPLYEIRCEVGRRLLSPDSVDEKEHLETLSRFQMLFGHELVMEFRLRLKRHELLPN